MDEKSCYNCEYIDWCAATIPVTNGHKKTENGDIFPSDKEQSCFEEKQPIWRSK